MADGTVTTVMGTRLFLFFFFFFFLWKKPYMSALFAIAAISADS